MNRYLVNKIFTRKTYDALVNRSSRGISLIFVRDTTLTFILLILAAVAFAGTAFGQSEIEVTGLPVPEFSDVDTSMQTFMHSNQISSGIVGIMKDGVILYQRGFGWKDEAGTIPMPENALVRVASCTKPVTAAAIRKLAENGDTQ